MKLRDSLHVIYWSLMWRIHIADRKQEPWLLRRQWTLHLLLNPSLTFPPSVNAKPRPEIRQGRQVQVKVPVAVTRNSAFWRRDAAAATIVVTTLVAAQGLPGGERAVADGALVGLPARIQRGTPRRSGGVGGGGRVVGGGLPVAGLVASESLVRREGLVADVTLVREIQRGRRRHCPQRHRWLFPGGGAPTGQHDETQSQVLFLSRGVLKTGSSRSLPLRPWLKRVQLRLLKFESRRHRRRRIQRFQSHHWL